MEKKNKKKNILVIVGILLVTIISYFSYQHFMYVETDNAQVSAHSVILASKVSGYVINVAVNDGQKVRKGDILVEIDDRDYQNTIKQIRGDLTSLQARKNDSERNYNRISTLFSSGAVSQQQFDSASSNLSEIRSKLEAIQAQVNQAELNIENTKIKAPSDGIIARRGAEIGQYASIGMALIGFVSSESRWITANLKETDIRSVKPGSDAVIEVDAIPNRRFKGRVENINPATGATFTLLPPDNATGNFTKVVQRVPVKIMLDQLTESDIELLRVGLSAVVKISKH